MNKAGHGLKFVGPCALLIALGLTSVNSGGSARTPETPHESEGAGAAAGPNEPPQQTRPPKVKSLTVYPAETAPGFIVRLTVPTGAYGQKGETHVLIGGKTVAVLRAASSTEIDVMVPVLPAGAADVVVRETASKRALAAGRMKILPPTAQQLILSLEDGRVTFLSAQPTVGEFTTPEESFKRRIAFDVLSDSDGLLFNGSVAHPEGRRLEVFEGRGGGKARLHGVEARGKTVFALKVPFVPQGARIRFYDVPESSDLNTLKGMTERTLINEIRVRNYREVKP